jgi:exodeoxyribonuclease V beta subunit
MWWSQQAASKKDADDRTSQRPPVASGVVTINTIHGSKGLEYRVVILADEITGKTLSKNAWGLDYCDHNGSIIDLTNEAYEPALLDQEQDLNRLLYVALTRAKHSVFLGVPDTGSALHRLLHDRDIQSLGTDHQPIEIPAIDGIVEPFKVPTTTHSRLKRPHLPSWFFRSFSGLIKHDTSHEIMSKAADEDDAAVDTDFNERWHGVPGGTDTGNFIHAVLEWHANDTRDTPALVHFINTNWPVHLDPIHVPTVIDWIQQILSTKVFPHVMLETLNVDKKRPEPQFELPLKRGLQLRDLINACAAFSWWKPVESIAEQSIDGHLIGFIDLVFEADGRFHLIDYKTNHLGPNDQAYSDERIESAMEHALYPFQAAIYALALHRWLKSRLANYDPEKHLGEVIYLFCRGVDAPNRGIWRRPIEMNGVLALEERCLCIP